MCFLGPPALWVEMKFFRTPGSARCGQPPLRAACCLHRTFCLVLKDYCGKSISCCPSWDWSRFPVYPEFASPRRLPGRKWSLQSELKCVAADVKSKQLRPGTQRRQKPGSGAERGELTPPRLCEVSPLHKPSVSLGWLVLSPGAARKPLHPNSRVSPAHTCMYSWVDESWRNWIA